MRLLRLSCGVFLFCAAYSECALFRKIFLRKGRGAKKKMSSPMKEPLLNEDPAPVPELSHWRIQENELGELQPYYMLVPLKERFSQAWPQEDVLAGDAVPPGWCKVCPVPYYEGCPSEAATSYAVESHENFAFLMPEDKIDEMVLALRNPSKEFVEEALDGLFVFSGWCFYARKTHPLCTYVDVVRGSTEDVVVVRVTWALMSPHSRGNGVGMCTGCGQPRSATYCVDPGTGRQVPCTDRNLKVATHHLLVWINHGEVARAPGPGFGGLVDEYVRGGPERMPERDAALQSNYVPENVGRCIKCMGERKKSPADGLW